jgi:Fe-S cluster biogenesis protein NfuA
MSSRSEYKLIFFNTTDKVGFMNVTFETTPNPATMKFIFSDNISTQTADFPSVETTDRSPLAAKIFGFPWVSAVFLGENFVTITKQDWVQWTALAKPLSGLLAEHVTSGQPVLLDLVAANSETENDSAIVKQIKRLIETEIRPVVALDGGDIAFVGYENNILSLKMMGACSGCPSSQATLKDGIEVRMKQAIPEIIEVIAV